VIWRLGVVGSPVAHSLSPTLHEAGLALAGLEGTSERVEFSSSSPAELRALMGERFDALSVTAPLKAVAAATCDALSDAARRTDSVNSLIVRDGQVEGASTDGDGFVAALEHEWGPVVAGAHALVLGSGGAARALVDALVRHGVASVVVEGRNASKVAELVARYERTSSALEQGQPLDLVVNTIPSGLRSGVEVAPGVHETTVAVDITYEPRATPWRSAYEAAGCRSQNGLAMLAFQAALQMQWWWGVALDGAALLEVLR